MPEDKSKKWCQKCGKRINMSSTEAHQRKFEFGFKDIELDLCNKCYPEVNTRFEKVNKKYSKKLLKIHTKFFQEVLR